MDTVHTIAQRNHPTCNHGRALGRRCQDCRDWLDQFKHDHRDPDLCHSTTVPCPYCKRPKPTEGTQ